jgi:crossover junction endodeoxyribonuclease RusA
VITIEVRGLPAPQGSKRHVGRGIMVESSKAVGPWREAVRAETQRVMAAWTDGGLDGPLRVSAGFYLPRPKGHYGTGRNADRVRDSAPDYPAHRPDLDKLVRSLLDGLTMGGAWGDDCQVVQLRVSKLYADTRTPGCRVQIEELEER